MIKQIERFFSYGINESECVVLKPEQVKHPLIKQIVACVLIENSSSRLGSEFGESQEAG